MMLGMLRSKRLAACDSATTGVSRAPTTIIDLIFMVSWGPVGYGKNLPHEKAHRHCEMGWAVTLFPQPKASCAGPLRIPRLRVGVDGYFDAAIELRTAL